MRAKFEFLRTRLIHVPQQRSGVFVSFWKFEVGGGKRRHPCTPAQNFSCSHACSSRKVQSASKTEANSLLRDGQRALNFGAHFQLRFEASEFSSSSVHHARHVRTVRIDHKVAFSDTHAAFLHSTHTPFPLAVSVPWHVTCTTLHHRDALH